MPVLCNVFIVSMVTELRMAFAMLDKDGDGMISESEMEEVMTSVGLKVKHKELVTMFEKVDLDG